MILFKLSVYALASLVGFGAGLWTFLSDAGVPGTIVVGLMASTMALWFFRACSAETRPGWMRLSAHVVFVVPAILAGFLAVNGVAKHVVPSEVWLAALFVAGALAVGVTALRRLPDFGMQSSSVLPRCSRPGAR